MNRNDVTKEQAARISKSLYRPMNFLIRLRGRMEKVGFPPGDPLYRLVSAAYDAVHHLSVHVHYLSCDGVGQSQIGGLPSPTLPKKE